MNATTFLRTGTQSTTTRNNIMNGYVCFYKQKRVEVHAETSLQAQQKAAEQLKVKPNLSNKVDVYLAEKDGEQVTHDPAML